MQLRSLGLTGAYLVTKFPAKLIKCIYVNDLTHLKQVFDLLKLEELTMSLENQPETRSSLSHSHINTDIPSVLEDSNNSVNISLNTSTDDTLQVNDNTDNFKPDSCCRFSDDNFISSYKFKTVLFPLSF